MKFLKTAAQRNKDAGVVKALLHKEVGGHEPARTKRIIHASDLTKEDPEYCSREVRLMELLDKKQRSSWIPTALRVTFDDGWEKQERITNRYLRKYMMGYWSAYTAKPVWSVGPPDEAVNFTYEEPFFRDPETKAVGSVDGIVLLPSESLGLPLEVKIMGEKQFRELKAPLWEHRLRTQFYLTLIDRSDNKHKDKINTEKASILYCLRGHGVKDENGEISPFKEFFVYRDDDAVRYLFDKAKELTVSRDGGPMPKQICPHQMCPRAEKCSVSRECFSEVGTIKD